MMSGQVFKMSTIEEKLKTVLIEKVIPQSEEYLEELHTLLAENKASKEDLEIIKDMESFLVELENIVDAIDKNMIDSVQCEDIYQKIINMIESH